MGQICSPEEVCSSGGGGEGRLKIAPVPGGGEWGRETLISSHQPPNTLTHTPKFTLIRFLELVNPSKVGPGNSLWDSEQFGGVGEVRKRLAGLERSHRFF